ncbi:hypothetical protein Pst134EA_002957 [Puccinia striiformis f. sp. tritici]|uniref:Uncharacterized protein n=1 Tax=Puccinia striiformis f. sp. tritici PST-78 TaxID=1165861 RepID=A0A0L0VUZ1_9BASI|nr:hypothetical protein Pst134EA_002957 [Puccinia striiformis f. sp. tritici]KAH9472335.1 hypothetical protein Pst134EA_002957 [Puccinia striiformis f. sp. tritici]KNF03002.1 hypothetical protein PSTG_03951 [Puccinia striiformis f. sp. tritici PST-78]
MSSISSSSSNIASLCVSDATSLSSSSSFDSFVFYPIEVAKPRLSKRTPVKTIIEQNLPHSSMSQLIVCLAGTSSGSLEEQIDSIRDYIYVGDAASYLEQYRKPSSLRAKRNTASLLTSIKKWSPTRQLEAQPFKPQPIVAAVASVSWLDEFRDIRQNIPPPSSYHQHQWQTHSIERQNKNGILQAKRT